MLEHKIPIFLAFGFNCLVNSIILSIGAGSDVLLTFVPGFSFVFTRPAPSKSVMAVAKIGISFVAFAADKAHGVEIASIKSFSSLTNFSAIYSQLDKSTPAI